MADINNIESVEDLIEVLDEYVKTPRVPSLSGDQLNIILKKIIDLAGGGDPATISQIQLVIKRNIISIPVVEGEFLINWQADLIPGDFYGRTYVAKYGNVIQNISGVWNNAGQNTCYTPEFSFTMISEAINIVTFPFLYPGSISII